LEREKKYKFAFIPTLVIIEDLFQKFSWSWNIISISLLIFVPEELISFMNETKFLPNLKRKLKPIVMM
jgi:hypothetical protein